MECNDYEIPCAKGVGAQYTKWRRPKAVAAALSGRRGMVAGASEPALPPSLQVLAVGGDLESGAAKKGSEPIAYANRHRSPGTPTIRHSARWTAARASMRYVSSPQAFIAKLTPTITNLQFCRL